jgi:hypothetical protein
LLISEKKLHLLCQSTAEKSLMNDARITGILTQIPHNMQKINEEASWKEVSSKKRNRNSSKKTMPRTQPKMVTG